MNNQEFQDIVKKYCVKAAVKLYDKEIKVFFLSDLGYVGIYKSEAATPPIEDYKEWFKKPFASITFESGLFTPFNELGFYERLWDYMIHEVTHIEVGVVCSKRWRISHPYQFYNAMNRNRKKVLDLKNDFLKEVQK